MLYHAVLPRSGNNLVSMGYDGLISYSHHVSTISETTTMGPVTIPDQQKFTPIIMHHVCA